MSDVETVDEGGVNRRAWLGGAAVAGIGVVGGAIAGAGVAAAQSSDGVARREQLIVDVACDGNTFREHPFPLPPDPADRRGSPFSVEGWMYPADTLSDGFIVTEDGSIGRWFCTGFFIRYKTAAVEPTERDEPHIIAQANFVFGSISGEQLFPPDTLITYGLGGTGTDARSHLAVLGGTGEHLGVLGQASRWNVGKNNTRFFPAGETLAPNFRYEFDLLYVI